MQKPLPTKFSDETGNYDGNDPTTNANLTFTRNSNATRVVLSASGQPLVEKVRTNLLTYSNTFDNAAWTLSGTGTLITESIANPFGEVESVYKLTLTSGGNIALRNVISSSAQLTASVYIKKTVSTTNVSIDCSDLDTANAAISTEWQRLDSTGTTPYGTTSFIDIVIGNVNEPVYLYCAQLETGDIPTLPIITTSAAVSVGPTANVPRLDYSGGGCSRLILEPQRTNLTTYSEAFGDTNWNKRSGLIVTSNYSTSPDGYQNADRVQKGTSLDGYIYKLYTFSASTTHTFSVYAKGTGTFGFNFYDGTSAHISDTYTLTSSWQRFTYTFTTNSTTAGGDYGIKVNNDAELWGAQLEAGSYATSYIPTLGASVTRLADSCWKTISAMSGSGYTSTLYVEIDGRFNPGPIDQIRWYPSADIAARFWIYTNVMGSAAAPIGESFPVDNPKHKFIFKAESSTSISIFYNGVKKTFYTSATTGNGYDTLEIYGQNANEGYNVSQILAFPTALTDAQCIELTTL